MHQTQFSEEIPYGGFSQIRSHILHYRHGCQPSQFWQDSPDTVISVPIVDSSSCACHLEDHQGLLMTTVVYGAVYIPFMGWRPQNISEKSCISRKKAFYRNLQIGNLETRNSAKTGMYV